MQMLRVFSSRLLATIAAIAIVTVTVGSFSIANGTRRTVYDFSGDNRTDFVTIGPPLAAFEPFTWKVLRNPALPGPAFIRVFQFGVDFDVILPADRVGDGKFDISVWRSGVYYSAEFPESSAPLGPMTVVQWGQESDNLGFDGDYDGDGKDDYTILRISANILNWFYKTATPANDRAVPFGRISPGFNIYAFQGADFTGDAREEFIVVQVENATGRTIWYIGDSISGAVLHVIHWGNLDTQILIQPDDYTGDGIADIAVWRFTDGSWWIRNTATGETVPPVLFGIPGLVGGDVPVRGDYDGDNIADLAVWRPSTREFFWVESSSGFANVQQWGEVGDAPLAALFTFKG